MNIRDINEIIDRQIRKYEITDEDWFTFEQRTGNENFVYITRKDWTFEDLFVRAFDVFSSDIGICGCGCPHETYEEILNFLRFCNWNDGYTEEQQEERRKFFATPYAQFMAYVLDDKGYVNHGTSIGGCFIEQKGKDFLAMLEEEFSTDDGVVSGTFGKCF